MLDSLPRPDRPIPIPEVSFRGETDNEGRLVWENAPDCPMEFEILRAPGYIRLSDVQLRPDDEEHTVVLSSPLVVSGTVRDAVTGEPIPKFRLGIGVPDRGVGGAEQPRWIDGQPFWQRFTKGEFRHSLDEPAFASSRSQRYVFRFDAEGYSSFVTRSFRTDEGEVRLDVKLRPLTNIVAAVYTPKGVVCGASTNRAGDGQRVTPCSGRVCWSHSTGR